MVTEEIKPLVSNKWNMEGLLSDPRVGKKGMKSFLIFL